MPAQTLSELAGAFKQYGFSARIVGDENTKITSVNTLEDAESGELSFLTHAKYRDKANNSRASALVVSEDFADGIEFPMPVIVSDNAYAGITVAIIAIHGYRNHPEWGVSPKAEISPEATIGDGANIGPFVTVRAGATIGRNVTIYPGCYIADHASIGDDCVLFPNVVIYDFCRLGDRVTLHAGTVIGEDGLGYAPVGEKWQKIPQIGRVEIGDDVELGALNAIDRATVGKTMIGSGTKFSNLIAIGHGTHIGEDCMFVAQVGLAGSVTVGRHVTFAGQAGIVGHITIGDNSKVGAQAGVTDSVPPDTTVLGSPAQPISEARRNVLLVKRLPDLRKKIMDMEKELKTLKESLNLSDDSSGQ